MRHHRDYYRNHYRNYFQDKDFKENIKHRNNITSGKGGLIFGVLLIFLGLNIISHHLLFYPLNFIFSWPAFLILLGIVGIITMYDKTISYIVLFIGVFFLMLKLFEVPIHGNVFWPVILIFIGLVIIFKRPGRDYKEEIIMNTETGSDYINDFSFFSGNKINNISKSFKGGRIVNIFGGSEINLLNAKLAPGRNFLDVTMIFGGSKIIAPPDWKIKVDVLSIFGGFSDKRVDISMNNENESESELIITGLVIFGGGDLRSY